jgi:glutamate-ammonia-ligase adenylyltransferase
LGGLELGYGSDLDIVFVHDIDLSLATDGKKSISCSEFFVKLVQRVSHIFTVKTYLDELYEIDLRLRPSGNSGLLISHIDTYKAYQESEAWTWEHQALVRARYIYGSETLGRKFTELRHQVLSRPRERSVLRKEVAEMREKMRSHLDKTNDYKMDLKQTSGGIADLEFLTQFWVLANTHTVPSLSKWTDNLRILDELATHQVIDAALAEGLQKAYLYIRSQVHRHNLTDKDIEHSEEMNNSMILVDETYKHTFSSRST